MLFDVMSNKTSRNCSYHFNVKKIDGGLANITASNISKIGGALLTLIQLYYIQFSYILYKQMPGGKTVVVIVIQYQSR